MTGETQFRFVAELSIGGQLLRVGHSGRLEVPLFNLAEVVALTKEAQILVYEARVNVPSPVLS